jgi:hypothetical protein
MELENISVLENLWNLPASDFLKMDFIYDSVNFPLDEVYMLGSSPKHNLSYRQYLQERKRVSQLNFK